MTMFGAGDCNDFQPQRKGPNTSCLCNDIYLLAQDAMESAVLVFITLFYWGLLCLGCVYVGVRVKKSWSLRRGHWAFWVHLTPE